MSDATPAPAAKARVVKRRLTGAVLPGHVAEARRRLGAGSSAISDDELARVLWVARALPAALDVLADTRASPGLAAARLSSAEVHAREGATGRLVALAALSRDGDELQVRFVRETDTAAPSVAMVVWQLSAKVGDDAGPPVIHRFVHGPRR